MAHLLLVDDDDYLRKTLATALAIAGHRVTQTGDGRQALQLFHAEPADLVITDLIMPDREGLETIIALRRERPALPIIAISGSVMNSKFYLDMARKLGAQRTLAKPFALSDLVRLIDELLAPPAQPPAGPR